MGFDIETKPVPELVEKFTKPYPDFDPDTVKMGNLKDPAKRAEKLESAKAEHEDVRRIYWKKAHEKAALNPFTGQIVVIGLISDEGKVEFLEGDEPSILRQFWARVSVPNNALIKWVFWSGCGAGDKMFDLDYIVTRSRIVGIRIPPMVRSGRYYAQRFIDLASEFLLYRREEYLKLTAAAELMGLYEWPTGPILLRKRDDDQVTGENFHLWYSGGLKTSRSLALDYLTNDLNHLFHLGHRLL